jgi:serine phosphatase RsbU (regulator of sigma subunit)
LQPGGAPVGLFKDSGYNSKLFRLEDGDILVACTDGIVEAESRNGELWGQQRLEDLFYSCGRRTPMQVLDCILNEVSAFTDGAPQKNDMTLLAMGVRAECWPAPDEWQI